ncbi:DNA-binding transcriptional regulator, GntR family [Lentibacillus halodurans]|uniref:DNA-binding transcriptional regulator, GntR family n=1 Tax=Lentibacillus halodurans TaxID=237679 RepID=A0A1I0XQE0_9BACI|nr:GntR family transcriptional regulator [Lentibacillus halodurans]SFB02676.1 DNA-binding transcriptional regulator, GntR family [Lentibacillus halodurans]
MSEKVDLRIGNREMLHNQVCSVLRSAILKGDFEPGERLVQTELAELTGVSRMPIREALRTLETEGLVKMEPHRGAVVRPIKKQDIQEIYELRSVLEPLALKKSIKNFSKDDFEALKTYHQSMIENESGEEYVEWNAKFHQLLSSRCQSPRLLGFIGTISRGFAQDTPQIIPGQIQKSNKEHEDILNAILNEDEEKAVEYLTYHISRTGEELLNSLENKDFK